MSADNYHMWTISPDGITSVWYVFASDFDWDDPDRHSHFQASMTHPPVAEFNVFDEALEWMVNEDPSEYGDFEVDADGKEASK